jgi:hypothetical protein
MDDIETTDLIEQLRLMEKQAHELVAQQYKVESLLKNALHRSPERHHEIVAENNAPLDDASSEAISD